MLKRTGKQIAADYRELVFLCIMGVITGAVVAVFEVIFGKVLTFMDTLNSQMAPWVYLLLPLIGVLVVWMFENWGGLTRKGMNLIFEVSQGKPERIPKRMVTMMSAGTWLSHLGGASTGREGVAIQIGAAVSYTIGHFLKPWIKIENARTIFLVTGMAAGFAGLFGTPFTAVFFAMEVLVAGVLKYRAMAPAICGSLTASWISWHLGLKPDVIQLPETYIFDLSHQWWQLLALGAVFGITGGLFAWSLGKLRKAFTALIPSSCRRILAGGIILAVLMWITGGRYCGGGANLIAAPFFGHPVYWYDWIMKFALTVFSLAVGYIGGEVTPLFSIGVCLGAILAPVLGLPVELAAALGCAAVFGAGTNTWLSAMMVGMELFGMEYFPFFFCVCSCAYLVNRNHSIYSLQQRYGSHDA